MPAQKSRKIFVNIPVKDLQRSMTFFQGLGFSFNPQFTDQTAACMVLSEEGYFMLLTEPKFREFSKRQVCDTRTHNEGLFAVAVDSRAEVDDLVKKAVTTGGKHANDPMDQGFMYGWSFLDPDGHHWEVFWMDPAHVQKS
jgi:uncharacterized protein